MKAQMHSGSLRSINSRRPDLDLSPVTIMAQAETEMNVINQGQPEPLADTPRDTTTSDKARSTELRSVLSMRSTSQKLT